MDLAGGHVRGHTRRGLEPLFIRHVAIVARTAQQRLSEAAWVINVRSMLRSSGGWSLWY